MYRAKYESKSVVSTPLSHLNALYAPSAAAPAPNHQQTVAALRHFGTIMEELKILKANPELGRSSIKSAITDGVIKLVADRMLAPASAVQQLASNSTKVPQAFHSLLTNLHTSMLALQQQIYHDLC